VHPSAFEFASTALTPDLVAGKRLVEAGAYNYNGSVAKVYQAMRPASYWATDMQDGPGVDMVCKAEDLPARFGDGTADVVICTEMLEHAEDWHAALAGMARVLAPGGVLVLTTRGPGFPYHPHPGDYWRFTVDLMDAAMAALGLHIIRLEPDPDPNSPGVFVLAVKPEDWPGADEVALKEISAPEPGKGQLGSGFHG
jgi:SAM-dependent methyltransferase